MLMVVTTMIATLANKYDADPDDNTVINLG